MFLHPLFLRILSVNLAFLFFRVAALLPGEINIIFTARGGRGIGSNSHGGARSFRVVREPQVGWCGPSGIC